MRNLYRLLLITSLIYMDNIDWDLLAKYVGVVETTPSVPEDVGFGREEDGISVGLSSLFGDERPEWMEQELQTCIHYTRDRGIFTTNQKTEGQPSGSPCVDPTTMHRMRQQGDDNRCRRGECCVYSMWFDPEYSKSGQHRCTHRCGEGQRRVPLCGASILKSSLFPFVDDEYAGYDPTQDFFGGRSAFASYARWRKLSNNT